MRETGYTIHSLIVGSPVNGARHLVHASDAVHTVPIGGVIAAGFLQIVFMYVDTMYIFKCILIFVYECMISACYYYLFILQHVFFFFFYLKPSCRGRHFLLPSCYYCTIIYLYYTLSILIIVFIIPYTSLAQRLFAPVFNRVKPFLVLEA